MKRKSKTGRKSYHLPSKVAVEARQQTGAGTHNKRPTRSADERRAIEESTNEREPTNARDV